MASDLPPAYDSLHTSSANIAVEDDSVPNCDDGPELIVNSSFEDKTTRIGFIQKVLTIKLLQLLLMAIVISIFAAQQREAQRSMRDSGVHIIVLSTLAFLATTGLLIYCSKARRKNPYRFMFLIVHPITLTMFVCFPIIYWEFLGQVAGASCSNCDPDMDFITRDYINKSTNNVGFISALALGFGTYIAAVLAVLIYSVFALQTKLEFASKQAVFLAGVVQILIYAFTVPFVYVDALGVLCVAIVLCLNYIYVFWDLEYMTSIKYWRYITPDNFVDGALNLHLDYLHILINIAVPQIRKKTSEFVNEIKVRALNDQ